MVPNTRSKRAWRLCLVSTVVLLCTILGSGQAHARGNTDRPEITVWLMPNEPAASVDPKADIDREVEQFNEELERRSIVVLNTKDSDLRQQLLRWNPDFAVPEWPIIKGQRESLLALGTFSEKHGVTVRVLIVNWGQAFDELRRRLARKEDRNRFYPDVAQIGSTWVAYFKEHDYLLPPPGDAIGDLDWRRFPDTGPTTLHYIFDVRLLYYWKRLPDGGGSEKPFQMKSDSWEAIIESFKDDAERNGSAPPRPPLAFPIGSGPNLLHDYVPLVWAGGGTFLDERSPRVDLTSDAALKIPLLLGKHSLFTDSRRAVHRLIAFPRMSHEEVLSPHFMRGRYRAVIEPVAFLSRWKKDFDQAKRSGFGKIRPEASFWDYCGVTVPPVSFKGGSDLMVVKGTDHPDVAFGLAKFLASDEVCKSRLAALGQLPAQDRAHGFGTEAMLRDLGAVDLPREAIEKSIIEAVAEGREYPPFARFASDLESPEVLAALQKVWDQIGKGQENINESDELRSAAQDAEHAINLRINWRTQFLHFFKSYWLHLTAAVLFAVAIFLLRRFRSARQRVREEKEKNRLLEDRARALEDRARALEERRHVRGFATASLSIVEAIHGLFKSVESKHEKKAAIVATLLRDWQRGAEDVGWQNELLSEVLWRSILSAVDSVVETGVFNGCPERDGKVIAEYLHKRGSLRSARELEHGKRNLCFQMPDFGNVFVSRPFMLEQAVVCLLQNAIQHSFDPQSGCYKEITVTYSHVSRMITVSNQAGPLTQGLTEAINGSPTLAVFEERLLKILATEEPKNWPGIGLVQAFCIANQFFGGLCVETTVGSINVSVRLDPEGT